MIIKINIKVDTTYRDDCERILFKSCKIYTNDDDAVKGTNIELEKHNLNNGYTLGSLEDIPVANAELAERFDDPMNMDAVIECEDITDAVRDRIWYDFWDVSWSDADLCHMAHECGIDMRDLDGGPVWTS